jgi:D-cysteine desulfhydrase
MSPLTAIPNADLRHFPRLSFAALPTPVERLSGLCAHFKRDDLFIKRDDISASPYGGNKVRKLEFILADAKRCGAVRVITSGAAGSNHALATALYAKKTGLSATLILFDQPPSSEVAENLLMDAAAGAELVYRSGYDAYDQTVASLRRHYNSSEGVDPFIIPPGGSSPVGALGFVQAGFELRGQIERGVLPEPKAVYAPLGTMGTAAGLMAGLRAAGLATRLVGVRVTPAALADPEKFALLYGRIIDLLTASEPGFRDLHRAAADIALCNDFYEPGYGLASAAVNDAVTLLRETDGIILDHTYTGKAFAALCADAAHGAEGPLLFWNTKNSHPFAPSLLAEGRDRLPAEFRRFIRP